MRILYYYSKLNVGGAERSTVRLLNLMAAHGHSVTLLLRWDGGLLEKELSSAVRVVHLKRFGKRNVSKARFLLETLLSVFRSIRLKKETYDVAISGLFGYAPAFLLRNVVAEQYYQLLRNDVEKTGAFGKTEEYMQRFGDRFDAYIGVSEYTTESFRRCYPQYAERALTIYNILPTIDFEKVCLAKDPIADGKDYFRIVTVCRLADQAKGLFRMVNVCRVLHDEFGDVFRWYVVGKGPDEQELRKRIKTADLESVMKLCGETDDPFPYYANADLVAVLSYNEGLCGVVNEAKMLCRPVIATRFSGIDEQLVHGVNGLIVDNEETAIINALRTVLANPAMLESMQINGMPEMLLDNDRKIAQYEELFKTIKEKEKKHEG